MFMCTENMPEYQGPKCKARIKKAWFYQSIKVGRYEYITRIFDRYVIGSDIYWDFVTRETKRSLGENLVAVNSIFGWLISGPVERSKQEIDETVTLTATQMLKTGCYAANDESGLNENISKFWDLDAVGIKDN